MWEIILRVLEGISYLCAPVVLVVAFLGLRQISVARDNRSLESQRDAVKLANENVRTFFEVILPKFEEAKISDAHKQAVRAFATKKDSVESDANLIDVIDTEKVKAYYSKEKDIVRKITKKTLPNYVSDVASAFNAKRTVFNLIEGFSSSFTSGLADEKIAYVAMGKAFVNVVKDYAELIKYFDTSAGYYRNITVLYSLWSKRLALEEIQKEILEIEKEHSDKKQELQENEGRIEKLKQDINKIELEEINLIGVAKAKKRRGI